MSQMLLPEAQEAGSITSVPGHFPGWLAETERDKEAGLNLNSGSCYAQKHGMKNA